MEETRSYRDEEEVTRDGEREEMVAAAQDDEVPFHIPRD